MELTNAVLCPEDKGPSKFQAILKTGRLPNDFRNVPILLAPSDLAEGFVPFLRPMAIRGQFEDVEHYLDVLFRLMREDFVGPLRVAIQYFLDMKSQGRLEQLNHRKVHIYFGVNVVKEFFQDRADFHTAQLNISRFRKVDWSSTKRLQNGNLVCLSSDNFRTFWLAKVVDRFVRSDDWLTVRLIPVEKSPYLWSCQSFVMVESPAFFEAYYHVLLKLKEFNKWNLPFQRYLVSTATDVAVPKYLSGRQAVYQISSKFRCIVLDFRTWPTAMQLQLDTSQYAAVKTALTKELAIIQGPPGTGKTFLGLKIVDILLANSQVWMSDFDRKFSHNCAPILVISYTNHALDQFLEGILMLKNSFGQCPKIVRVGSRSNSEVLKPYNLTALRRLSYANTVSILRSSQVIGMTTTGAAKYKKHLCIVAPRIVVVEEAAEVMESHVVTALTEHCQHLILIGDHQQLRPTPANHILAKNFQLDVSLFERLVMNGVHCDRLELQHRMRPEIASLLVPHIYQTLKNHESVERYEHIQGVSQDLFFVDHRVGEAIASDTCSLTNSFEAGYVIALCRYLLNQGYQPARLTILTPYVGQLMLLREMIVDTDDSDLGDVCCTTVDSYQGEENDIVIMSLVRSNADGVIGFLRVDNRVCVALSRARMGLYVIGNFKFLAENSDLWKPIVQKLTRNGSLGPALTLYCPNHTNTLIKAALADHFQKAPEGGCELLCHFQLVCGHRCTRLCHGYDRSHEAFQCQEQCKKILCELGHQCPQKCHEDCQKCVVPVSKKMTKCKHENMIPCGLDPAEFSCEQPCERVLPCGCTVKIPCSVSTDQNALNDLRYKCMAVRHVREYDHWSRTTASQLTTARVLDKLTSMTGALSLDASSHAPLSSHQSQIRRRAFSGFAKLKWPFDN